VFLASLEVTAMEPPRARTAITQLLALIHTCPNAQAVTLLAQSIHV
jgi:hypothetical protein